MESTHNTVIDKKNKIIYNEDDDVGTLPFYSDEIDNNKNYHVFDKIKSDLENTPLFHKNGLFSRFLKIYKSENNFLNIGLFRRKTEFNLKKRIKLIYIYLFPYLYIFFKMFFSRILVKINIYFFKKFKYNKLKFRYLP